jgi:hypothetical protein
MMMVRVIAGYGNPDGNDGGGREGRYRFAPDQHTGRVRDGSVSVPRPREIRRAARRPAELGGWCAGEGGANTPQKVPPSLIVLRVVAHETGCSGRPRDRPEHVSTPSERDAKHLALAGAEAEPLVRHVERAVGADRRSPQVGKVRPDTTVSGAAPRRRRTMAPVPGVGPPGVVLISSAYSTRVSPGQPEHLLEPACPNSQVSRLRQTVDVLVRHGCRPGARTRPGCR